MAVTGITINWQTRVITVLRDYLGTPTQTVPSTIYSLETDDFRLDLKQLEESVAGMPHLDTHQHNTEVPLGGVIYARVIEIINGYTITFEDGQYAVNLFGSNNNIGDVINVNQVSIRTNNSAGLIVDPGIAESISYGEAIIYDENSGFSGDRYPVGTRAQPVNNIPDLQSLLNYYNRTVVTMISSMTLTQPISDIYFRCYTADEAFDSNGYQTIDCSFLNLRLEGNFMESNVNAIDCHIGEVYHLGGVWDNCNILGPIHMAETVPLTIKHSVSVIPGTNSPVLDMGHADASLNFRDYSGGIRIQNCTTSGATATLEMNGGKIHIDPSCTAGVLDCRGLAYLNDNSSGTTVISNALLDPDVSQNLNFNGKVTINVNSIYSGTLFPIGTDFRPVNNLEDALMIASDRGLNELFIEGDWTFVSGDTIYDFLITGEGLQSSTFTFEAGSFLPLCNIHNAKCTGDLTGPTEYINCHLSDIGSSSQTPTNIDILATDCLISGEISLTEFYSGIFEVVNCKSGSEGIIPVLNIGNSNSDFFIRNYTGAIEIKNSDKDVNVSIDMISGEVILDETVSGGTWVIRGLATFTNNTTGSAIVNSVALLDPNDISVTGGTGSSGTCDTEAIVLAVWNELMTSHQVDGSFGKAIQDLLVKADNLQHTSNVQTEMLKNKPNNP